MRSCFLTLLLLFFLFSSATAAPLDLNKPKYDIMAELWSFHRWEKELKTLKSRKMPSLPVHHPAMVIIRKLERLLGAAHRKNRQIDTMAKLFAFVKENKMASHPELTGVFPDLYPLTLRAHERLDSFLKESRVPRGLAQNINKETMIARWLRWAHILAYEPQRGAALFTRSFRERLYCSEKIGPYPALKTLWNLCKIYYHFGLKYTKDDKKTYADAKKTYGALVLEKEKNTRIFQEPKGPKLVFKVEKGGWRLDDIIFEK